MSDCWCENERKSSPKADKLVKKLRQKDIAAATSQTSRSSPKPHQQRKAGQAWENVNTCVTLARREINQYDLEKKNEKLLGQSKYVNPLGDHSLGLAVRGKPIHGPRSWREATTQGTTEGSA